MKLLQRVRDGITSTLQKTIGFAKNAVDANPSQQGVQLGASSLNPITSLSRGISGSKTYQDLINRPQTVEADPFTNFMANRIGRPFLEIPQRVSEASDPNKGFGERGLSALRAVGGAVPALDDFFVTGLEGMKEQAAGNDPNRVLQADQNYDPTPLGDILRNQGEDDALASALDVAELPLLLGGVIATGKGANRLVPPKAPRVLEDVADSVPLARSGVEEILNPIIRETPQVRGLEAIPDVNVGEEAISGIRNLRNEFPQPKQIQESFDNILQVPVEQPQILSQVEQAAQDAVDTVRQVGDSRAIRSQAPDLRKEFGNLPRQLEETIPKDIPKIPSQVDEAINTLRSMKDKTVKELNAYQRKILEPRRVLRRMFPEDQEVLEQVIWRPLNDLRGQAADFKRVYENRVKQLGKNFKAGSKYSELTHKFGEGRIGREQLVKQVGEAGAVNIENASKIFRQMYDEILDSVNAKRVQAGLQEIKKRGDYFRHMNELDGTDILDSLTTGRPVEGSPVSSSIMRQRKGNKTKFDAVGGFMQYLQYAGRAGYTDTIAPRLKDIARQASKGGNYQASEYLDWLGDSILGVRSKGGVERVVDQYTGKVMGSRVVGNLSSLWNQLASLPTGAGDAGFRNVARGLVSKEASQAWEKSPYAKAVSYRPDDQLYQGLQRTFNIGANAMQDLDVNFKRTVWQGMYENAKRSGQANPSQWADEATELVMGIRDVGGQSQFQSSTIGRLLAPFTQEAQTQMNRYVELFGEKKFGKILGIAAANWLFNEVSQRFVTGNRVLFDPIQATVDATQQFFGTDDREKNEVKAFGRILGETLALSPVVESMFATGVQGAEFLAGNDTFSNTLFGSEDPTRFGAGSMYAAPIAAIIDPPNITGVDNFDRVLAAGARMVPYGNQALKTAQAASALNRGAVESRNDRAMFGAPDNALGAARTLAFGPYASNEAQDYFNSDFARPLSEQETDLMYALPDERKADFLENRQKTIEQKNRSQTGQRGSSAPSENILDRLLGRNQDFSFGEYPTDKESQKIYKENVGLALDAGEIPPADALKQAIFDGKSVKSERYADRKDAFVALRNAMDDEWYSDEQKKAIMEASGANQAQLEYFQFADKTVPEKLEELLPTLGDLSDPKNFGKLAFMRAKLAGEQGMSSDMVTYLYQQEYISKDQYELLNALDYDELQNKFYFKRGSKYGKDSKRGKKLSYNEALKLYSGITVKQMNNLKSSHYDLTQYGVGSGLLESILAK